MADLFDEHMVAVRKAYTALLAAPLVVTAQAVAPARAGIYVFYDEPDQPRYVGRTRNLRRRLRQHAHPDATHYSASFAFAWARREGEVVPSEKLTRAALAADPNFALLFAQYRQRVGQMWVRWVEEEDDVVQTLLEVYAAVTLGTTPHYNSFRTS
jgi:hypothetical protein